MYILILKRLLLFFINVKYKYLGIKDKYNILLYVWYLYIWYINKLKGNIPNL